jgi:hypothetical protein
MECVSNKITFDKVVVRSPLVTISPIYSFLHYRASTGVKMEEDSRIALIDVCSTRRPSLRNFDDWRLFGKEGGSIGHQLWLLNSPPCLIYMLLRGCSILRYAFVLLVFMSVLLKDLLCYGL